jgi:hypothetical protein
MENKEQIEESKRLSSQLAQRLISTYQLINKNALVEDNLVTVLCSVHHYNYAQRISGVINDKQGRNRFVYDSDKAKLMEYSVDEDVDIYVDTQLNRMLVSALNYYLSDKQELPPNKTKANSVMNKVKALLMMIISTNQYGLLPELNIPPYAEKWVDSALDYLAEQSEDITNEWILYLEESGNSFLIDEVLAAGERFWGLDSKGINTYMKYFQKYLKDIVNPEETYEKYKYFRMKQAKVSRNITIKSLCEFFETNEDKYNTARRNIFNEFAGKYSEDENSQLILKLIYNE